ncbi:MAG: glucokinase [Rhodocyclaceae bacterium]|nr:glucokinase [Rhodocyclaceae bacterium]
MRLLGDIGGTKALLALGAEDAPAERFLVRQKLACADYRDFPSLLTAFLSAAGVSTAEITGGCLAVAGPIADDGLSARLTNLPWTVDAQALARQCGIGPLRLVNDFAAAALGTTALHDEQRVVLQPGQPLDTGVRLVIGAGTGLGMATLIPERQGWRVLPGEGGHTGFAPADALQAELWVHLRCRHDRVSYEHIVSGPGLVEIYRFTAGTTADPALFGAVDPAAAVAAEAMQRPGSAREALDLFVAIFGAFAGDMALALMARGGVFVAGGIAARIMPALQSGRFTSAFCAKGGHSALAARMPIAVVTEDDLGLIGAALYDRSH